MSGLGSAARVVCVLAAAAVFLGGCGATSAARRTSYPATFVAVGPGSDGIAVYSSITGKRLHWLSHADRASYPILAADRRWVYFSNHEVPTRGAPCQTALWRVRPNGKDLSRVASVTNGGFPAVNPEGSIVAWIVGGPKCSAGEVAVLVENLRTGKTHRIEGTATDLALSPSGTLAVVAPAWETDFGEVRLIRHPFTAKTINGGALVPCPVQGTCDDESPTFARDGRLFYVAMTNPHPAKYCLIHNCSPWTYSLIRGAGARSTVLTAQNWPINPGTSATVDTRGTAVIYTMPKALWRWWNGHTTLIPSPYQRVYYPAW